MKLDGFGEKAALGEADAEMRASVQPVSLPVSIQQ